MVGVEAGVEDGDAHAAAAVAEPPERVGVQSRRSRRLRVRVRVAIEGGGARWLVAAARDGREEAAGGRA